MNTVTINDRKVQAILQRYSIKCSKESEGSNIHMNSTIS